VAKLERLPAGMKTAAQARERMWQRGLHWSVAKALGRWVPFEYFLRQALLPPHEHFCCGVPVPYAQGALGQGLFTSIPVTALTFVLPDWVRCGGGIHHLSDHFVCAGEWRSLRRKITETGVFREAQALLDADFLFREMPIYRQYVRRAKNGNPVSRNQILLDREERIDAYFERFVEQFRWMERDGFLRLKTAQRLTGSKMVLNPVREQQTERGEQDLGVAIDADGQLMRLPGGQHRFAVASLLEISVIPVEVRMVHVDWLRRIDREGGAAWTLRQKLRRAVLALSGAMDG
jgi:hypothetical protein